MYYDTIGQSGGMNILKRLTHYMSQQSAIKKGVLLSYFVIIFNIVAGFIYTPWMIAKIGKENYGLYILVTSFLAYFTVDYGLWQAVNKLVAEHHSKGDPQSEHHVVNVAMSLYLFITLCIAAVLIVVFFYIDDIYSNLTESELSLFKTLFIIASAFALLSFPFIFLQGVLMGREYFVPVKLFDMLKRVGVIILTIILLAFDCGVVSLVIAFGITPIVIRFWEYIYLWRKGFRIRPVKPDRTTSKAIIGLSAWLFIIVLCEMLITNISPSLLAAYCNTTQIAIFAIGLTLYNYVYAFAGAINGFFLPRIFKLRNQKNNEAIISTSSMVSAIQMFVVGLFIMGIICLGKEFINLWVGYSFEQSYTVVLWLLFPAIIIFCQPIENTELFATNKLYCQASMKICTAIFSILLSIMLCPVFGAVGAAVAVGISSFLFLGVGQNILFWKILRRTRTPFILLLLRYLFSFTVACGLYFLIDNFWITPNSWRYFFIHGFIFITIYFIVVYALGLPESIRRSMITPILNRFLNHNKHRF